MRRTRRQPCFTILELLVVIGILGVLIGLIVPGLSSARRQAKRTFCLANLHALVQAMTTYAADDPRGQILPVHPIADRNALHDEGFFDYGGATGAATVWEGLRFGPSSERTAESRPLNDVLFSQTPDTADGAWRVFRCPADVGLPDAAHLTGNPRIFDSAMRKLSMFDSVGTSYLGNAYREITDGGRGKPRRFRSISPFLRSMSEIPAPGSTVVLCEAIMWFNTTAPVGIDGSVGWLGLRGWHGAGARYNATFADGHAAVVHAPAGALAVGSDPERRRLYIRGRAFRFDTFPGRPIEDLPERIEEP